MATMTLFCQFDCEMYVENTVQHKIMTSVAMKSK